MSATLGPPGDDGGRPPTGTGPTVDALRSTTDSMRVAQIVLGDGSLNPRLFPELALIERGSERFDFGFRFGWEVGYDVGYRQAERDMASEWAKLAEWVRRQMPTDFLSFAEIQRRRAER